MELFWSFGWFGRVGGLGLGWVGGLVLGWLGWLVVVKWLRLFGLGWVVAVGLVVV